MSNIDNASHPAGAIKTASQAVSAALAADTFAGKIHVEWDPTAAVTPIGQRPYSQISR